MMKWVLFFFIISSRVIGQHAVEGRVVDKETGEAIPFASIGILETPHGTISNLQGEFSLLISDSSSIKVTCLGYESLVINSIDKMELIQLKPVATQLGAVLITNKPVNPNKIVRKAFASISNNYDNQSFLQKFFYRHYSLANSVYEKLIEASVDVWKHEGYTSARSAFGEREELRVTQLRRSLDLTEMIQGQRPLWIGNILQTDIVGYQSSNEGASYNIFEASNNLKADFSNYRFKYAGITSYDGQDVYKIEYVHRKDSILTASGYKVSPEISGSLFITTDTYAFVKTENVKYDEFHTTHTTAHYKKYGDKYYPYHLMKEGEDRFIDKKFNSYHIELMSVDIRHGEIEKFTGHEPGRAELLKIPYDSMFWGNFQILKTTPLEDEIIHDLGHGISLNKQFFLYKQYEQNVTDGGKDGEKKFNWLLADSKDKRILYVCFWNSDFQSYWIDMEYIKRLNQTYKNKILFILVSFEEDEAKWQLLVTKHNYFSDGIVNYRISESSETAEQYNIKKTPAFILISKDGSLFDSSAKRPSDPLLEKDFKSLIEQPKQ
jgi:hypothetical protein